MTTTAVIHRAVLHERPTAVLRARIDAARMPRWLPAAYQAIEEYLTSRGMSPAGPPFARFSPDRDKLTVEAGFPVSRTIVGDGYVVPSVLPHGPVAIAVHCGSYETLEHTYSIVQDWLASHGYAQDGDMWEVYLTDPTTQPEPDQWRTEVIVPYRAE